jgi:hypothetical protein
MGKGQAYADAGQGEQAPEQEGEKGKPDLQRLQAARWRREFQQLTGIDPRDENAVKAWQAAHHVPPTGRVYRLTIDAARQAKPTAGAAPPAAQPQAPSHDAEIAVLDAVVHIMSQRPTEIARRDAHPSHYFDGKQNISPHWASLLWDWFQVTNADVEQPDGNHRVTRGRKRRDLLNHALRETAPLVETLGPDSGYPAVANLIGRYYARARELAGEVIVEQAHESIEAGAQKNPGIDLDALTEEEKVRAGAFKAIDGVKATLSSLSRAFGKDVASGEAAAQHAAQVAAFNKAFHSAANEAGTYYLLPETPQIQKVAATMKAGDALAFAKAGLDGVVAILSVADPEQRKRLLLAHSTYFGFTADAAQIVTLLGQFVSGVVAVSGAATYALAKALGNTQLAAQALKAVPALKGLTFALNVVGVVHGVAVLLDPEASPEAKEKAALEVFTSTVGIVGTLTGATALSFGLTMLYVNYVWFSELGSLGDGFRQGAVQLGLTQCFEDMRDTALDVQTGARRMAVAAELERTEQDPAVAAEIRKEKESWKRMIIQHWLKPYLQRATGSSGRDRDPAAYGPAMTRRFKPLLEMPMETDVEVLDVAMAFIQVVAKCFNDGRAIVREAVDWLARR